MSSTLDAVKEAIKKAVKQSKEFAQLNLSEIKINKFTPEIKKEIEKYPQLEIMILNDCDLQSLQNFPELDFTALDLTLNKLTDSDLSKIAKFKSLGQLIMNENNITKLQSLLALQVLQNLAQVDFSDNPVTQNQNYREFVFQNLKQLEVLDRFDKEGNQIVDQEQFQDDSDDQDQADFDDQEDDQSFSQDQGEQSPQPKKKR